MDLGWMVNIVATQRESLNCGTMGGFEGYQLIAKLSWD
jgi:hypothetical protein